MSVNMTKLFLENVYL